MLDTWEGGWDSGFSCWALAREAGIVDLHVGHLGRGWGSGSSCSLGRGAGIVDLDVGHLQGRLGDLHVAGGWDGGSSMLDTWEGGWDSMLDTWEGGWDSGACCTLGREAGIVGWWLG